MTKSGSNENTATASKIANEIFLWLAICQKCKTANKKSNVTGSAIENLKNLMIKVSGQLNRLKEFS